MTKSKKLIKDSTTNGADTKIVSWRDEYQDLVTLSWNPISDIYLDKIAVQMVEYFEANQTAMLLEQFYATKRIHKKTMDRWAERHEVLAKAKEYCKMLLHIRRENKAISDPTVNVGTLNFMMPFYSTDWTAITEWRAQLKNAATVSPYEGENKPLL